MHNFYYEYFSHRTKLPRNSLSNLSLIITTTIRFISIEGGGELTQFMTGKKQRPRTEPMYSGGTRMHFPISRGYNSVVYKDFIASYTTNSERILITQTIHNGRFSGCFGTSKLYSPRPPCCGWIRPNYGTFLKDVKEERKWVNGKSYMIYSLACHEKYGFGVFFMENFGTAQTILTATSDIKTKK